MKSLMPHRTPLSRVAAVLVLAGLAAFWSRGAACSMAAPPAFEALLDSVPADQREAILGSAAFASLSVGEAAVQAVAPAAILPGRDIAPSFSDPIRVGIILKIVSDVYDGKPLPFPKDGTIFDNREGRLPGRPAGYYREYTILPPPGSPMIVTIAGRTFRISPPQGRRGAERLIIGGGEVLYYSPDHYRTFIALQVLR